jgi:UDP-N-acetylglucosamine 2-epimerase (non-hydrolysing)
MKVLVIFGTRPEAIKLAPVIKALQHDPMWFEVVVCTTAQHRQMLDQVLAFFKIAPAFDLDLMTPNQSISAITARSLGALDDVFAQVRPDHVIVQGDATTAFVGALAAYYCKTAVSHIEAGLRSKNIHAPYPEEMNRILVSDLAHNHFAPTERAKANLAAEGISKNVWVVGNTVIDALLVGLDLIRGTGEQKYLASFRFLDFSRPIVLITVHRRESFGEPFANILDAINCLAARFQETQFVYPVHLNPNIKEPAERLLRRKNIYLIPPLDYASLIWLMTKVRVIMTDSGGIQEEAPSLGKPVLVLRDVTERIEGIEAGTARLVGTTKEVVVAELSTLLTQQEAYEEMARATNPYGDGTASQKIADILRAQNKP